MSSNNHMHNFIGTGAVLPEVVTAAEKALGITLPEDYRTFLEDVGGGEGWVGDHYLVLWRATDLHQWNIDYEFPKYAPAFIAFGSDGGGEAFAFDVRHDPYSVVVVPFIGMSERDGVWVSASFTGLLNRMAREASLF